MLSIIETIYNDFVKKIMIGLIRQPKYGHLKELHRAVKMCEKALVSADPIVTSLGSSQQVLLFVVHIVLFSHHQA